MSFSLDVKTEICDIEPIKDCCIETLEGCFDTTFLENAIAGKCCVKTFLRQAFITYGSINDPENSYHLELDMDDESLATMICILMNDYNMGAKTTFRNSNFVVYIKGSDAIADFLRLIGANNAVLTFENVRIVKEVRKNINRAVNCESGNIQKKVDAAFRQVKSIELIRDTEGISSLTPELQEVANLRLHYPEAGLAELAEKLDFKLSKSGISHRLNKIVNIAKDIEESSGK